ncbi:membrane-binding protein [Flavobacterium cyanobacteriorum]|uniref:Membrane-binding protein n=1 Tax=Flavobacterium cyanobacteriorum TaxID=2022802 RepID=A0A255ZA42_9FLAO|nr:membrane-binding protein [Flavobacterium cyanobacteriorum]OYQ38281.1 membrane-binding protein [Flavobacterium cyanobacteriorum]
MRKIIVAGLLLSAFVVTAQNAPKYQIENKMVKATYYYDNGQVKQEGFYKDGKLHGKWVAFNEDGTRQAIGEYNNGAKTGKWFFWSGTTLNEVDYADSRVAEVKKWSNSSNAVVAK